jgi:hypothetical protein
VGFGAIAYTYMLASVGGAVVPASPKGCLDLASTELVDDSLTADALSVAHSAGAHLYVGCTHHEMMSTIGIIGAHSSVRDTRTPLPSCVRCLSLGLPAPLNPLM